MALFSKEPLHTIYGAFNMQSSETQRSANDKHQEMAIKLQAIHLNFGNKSHRCTYLSLYLQ